MSRRTPADPELARRLGSGSVLGVAAGATAAALLGAATTRRPATATAWWTSSRLIWPGTPSP
ncbi:hypothetical protein [Streptomyces sp. NPDC047982]|uniref:hypothetical protein n=1 Tax=Streptomyces sp. NPDC047982 TaxID=3365495 RepID=UPI003717C974